MVAGGSPRHDTLHDPVEYIARDAEKLMETVVKVRQASSEAEQHRQCPTCLPCLPLVT